MTTFNGSFGDIVGKFAKKTNATVLDVHRGLSKSLFRSVINATPVDTGEAAGGWVASVGTPVDGPTGVLGRAAAVAAMESVVDAAPIEKALYLANSVDHIEYLEYGHSKEQAPNGMVRVNIADFRRFLAKAVEERK